MEKCYFSPKHTKERWIGIICSLFVSITLTGFGVFTSLTTEDGILSYILIFLGVFFMLYGILYDLYMFREYELSENGITIRYAKKRFSSRGSALAKFVFAEYTKGKLKA